MNLSDFATDLVAKNNFIKASFGGFAGSGKSRTATEFTIGAYKLLGLTKPILIIDNEKGSRFLEPIFKKAGIKTLVKDTTSLSDVLQAFQFIRNGDIDWIFMDSLTKVWYQYVRDYRKKNRRTFMTLQDWGKILPSWQEQFADPFVELEGNCVFTGRGGYTYDMEENDETKKKEFVKSGVKMKMAGETPFEPDLNIWMEQQQEIVDGKPKVWREAMVMKDRSNLIDGKVFKNPNFEVFKPVVEFLMSVPKGEVSGTTSNENLAPSEEYSDRKKRRDIAIEEIKGIFERLGLGTSVNDKKMKAYVSENIFGTTSIKAMESMKLDDLEKKVIQLKCFKTMITALHEQGLTVTDEEIDIALQKSLEEVEEMS